MQTTLMGKSNRLTKMPELYANHISTYDSLASNELQTSISDEDTDDQSPGLVKVCCLLSAKWYSLLSMVVRVVPRFARDFQLLYEEVLLLD